ncbi:MAG: choice-of-anchor B family protein [Flavobacteriales bacterium]|nr:choice-of-anchor B family protein [Flavobacteriales bacterium]
MKILYTVLFIALSISSYSQTPCYAGMAGIYPCNNVDLMAFVTLSDLGVDVNGNTNDVWGWVGPSGKEYAIVGSSNGTTFLDVSNPAVPINVGFLPTHTISSLWRDVESRGNYLFVGSEAQDHGLQVFDLMELETATDLPVDFEETAHYNGFGNSHTISIDQQSGYLYANGTGTFSGGLHIVNINNPLNPVVAGGFEAEGYTHDSFAFTYNGPDTDFTGSEIVMACNGFGPLVAVDVTDKTDCQTISTVVNDNQGYIHQGWFTEDQRYFLMNDEMDENFFDQTVRTHIFDCEDLNNMEYIGYYAFEQNAIDHNLYIKGDKCYESNYTTGLRILDVSDVANLNVEEVAYFDLYPSGDPQVYQGTWSNYPFFTSGTVLATNMYEGVYILYYEGAVETAMDEEVRVNSLNIYPNPAENIIGFDHTGNDEITVSDVTGKVVLNVDAFNSAGNRFSLNVSSLDAGVYFLNAGENGYEKFVKR